VNKGKRGAGLLQEPGSSRPKALPLLTYPCLYLRTTRVWAAMSPRRWFLPEISTAMKATR
jgi:hypothetical protein